jgi:hypothetical protein
MAGTPGRDGELIRDTTTSRCEIEVCLPTIDNEERGPGYTSESEQAMPKKQEIIPRLRVRKGATLREIYKAAWEQFTAADLQKFTEIEPMMPFEQLVEELEAIQREADAKLATKKAKKKKKRCRPTVTRSIESAPR